MVSCGLNYPPMLARRLSKDFQKKLVLPCGLNCFDHLANADTLAALNHRSSSGYRAEIPNLVIMINGLCRSLNIGAVFVGPSGIISVKC